MFSLFVFNSSFQVAFKEMSPLKNKRLSHAMLNYIISLLDKPRLLKILKNEHPTSRQAISTDIISFFSVLITLMGHPIFIHITIDVTSWLVNTSNSFFSSQNLELVMKFPESVPVALVWWKTKELCHSEQICIAYSSQNTIKKASKNILTWTRFQSISGLFIYTNVLYN